MKRTQINAKLEGDWKWLARLRVDDVDTLSLVWLSLELTLTLTWEQFVSFFWVISFLRNNCIHRDRSQLPQFVQMLIFKRPTVQGKHTFNSAWDITIRLTRFKEKYWNKYSVFVLIILKYSQPTYYSIMLL